MKKYITLSFVFVGLAFFSCNKVDVKPDVNGIPLYFTDSSSGNPNNSKYLDLLQRGKESGLPGISLLVYTANEGLWVGASGYADLETKIKMSPANLFRLASVTKTFVATAVLKLAEENRLNLDVPMSDYLENSLTHGVSNAGSATVRQAIQHTSGVFNFTKNPNFKLAVINDPYKVWSCDEKMSYARHQDPYFAPGEGWRYSNTNYLLLGKVIEKVTGMTFEAYIRSIIFDPLKMQYTWFGSENRFPDGLVRSYVDMYGEGTLREVTAMDAGVFGPEGGMIATSYDLGIFIKALFDGQILNQHSMQTMMQFVNCTFDQSYYTQYGLGLMNWETVGGVGYGHGGSLTGFSTEMFYFPEKKTTIIVLVNVGILGESPTTQLYQDFLIDITKTVFD